MSNCVRFPQKLWGRTTAFAITFFWGHFYSHSSKLIRHHHPRNTDPCSPGLQQPPTGMKKWDVSLEARHPTGAMDFFWSLVGIGLPQANSTSLQRKGLKAFSPCPPSSLAAHLQCSQHIPAQCFSIYSRFPINASKEQFPASGKTVVRNAQEYEKLTTVAGC